MRAAFQTVALPVGRKIVSESDAIWFISKGVVLDEIQSGQLVALDLASPMLSGPVGVSQAKSASMDAARSVLSEKLEQTAKARYNSNV